MNGWENIDATNWDGQVIQTGRHWREDLHNRMLTGWVISYG